MKQRDKIDIIIETAQRRFTHYGVAKTTMTEIAGDLGISKASLYYYFQDKLSLYAAVLKRIINAGQAGVGSVAGDGDVLKSLKEYLSGRKDFIIENYRIIEYLFNITHKIPDDLRLFFEQARTADAQAIRSFVEKADETGVLSIPERDDTAALLTDCLAGLRITTLRKNKTIFPTPGQFDDLLKKEIKLVEVFFKAYRKEEVH